jgi:hypothetical protein
MELKIYHLDDVVKKKRRFEDLKFVFYIFYDIAFTNIYIRREDFTIRRGHL